VSQVSLYKQNAFRNKYAGRRQIRLFLTSFIPDTRFLVGRSIDIPLNAPANHNASCYRGGKEERERRRKREIAAQWKWINTRWARAACLAACVCFSYGIASLRSRGLHRSSTDKIINNCSRQSHTRDNARECHRCSSGKPAFRSDGAKFRLRSLRESAVHGAFLACSVNLSILWIFPSKFPSLTWCGTACREMKHLIADILAEGCSDAFEWARWWWRSDKSIECCMRSGRLETSPVRRGDEARVRKWFGSACAHRGTEMYLSHLVSKSEEHRLSAENIRYLERCFSYFIWLIIFWRTNDWNCVCYSFVSCKH